MWWRTEPEKQKKFATVQILTIWTMGGMSGIYRKQILCIVWYLNSFSTLQVSTKYAPSSLIFCGVGTWKIPLECSTWSSKVTELLLFPDRFPWCCGWEEPSVEKLSSSITSVPGGNWNKLQRTLHLKAETILVKRTQISCVIRHFFV